jgi:hypothetical protein
MWGGQSWPQPPSEELPRKLLITIDWLEVEKMPIWLKNAGQVPLQYGPAPTRALRF